MYYSYQGKPCKSDSQKFAREPDKGNKNFNKSHT